MGIFPEPRPDYLPDFPGPPFFDWAAAPSRRPWPSFPLLMMSTLIDTRWDSNVRPLFSDLVQVLDPDSFLNRLYSARLVTKGEYNHLLSMSSREDKSRELLNDILPRKGPNSYDRFVAILRETEGQEHVAKALGERMGNNDRISTYTYAYFSFRRAIRAFGLIFESHHG